MKLLYIRPENSVFFSCSNVVPCVHIVESMYRYLPYLLLHDTSKDLNPVSSVQLFPHSKSMLDSIRKCSSRSIQWYILIYFFIFPLCRHIFHLLIENLARSLGDTNVILCISILYTKSVDGLLVGHRSTFLSRILILFSSTLGMKIQVWFRQSISLCWDYTGNQSIVWDFHQRP